MGMYLDIDDCCAHNLLALEQLKDMRNLIKRVANLNPDAGEIGEGMLRQLIDEAKRLTY